MHQFKLPDNRVILLLYVNQQYFNMSVHNHTSRLRMSDIVEYIEVTGKLPMLHSLNDDIQDASDRWSQWNLPTRRWNLPTWRNIAYSPISIYSMPIVTQEYLMHCNQVYFTPQLRDLVNLSVNITNIWGKSSLKDGESPLTPVQELVQAPLASRNDTPYISSSISFNAICLFDDFKSYKTTPIFSTDPYIKYNLNLSNDSSTSIIGFMFNAFDMIDELTMSHNDLMRMIDYLHVTAHANRHMNANRSNNTLIPGRLLTEVSDVNTIDNFSGKMDIP